MSRTRFIVISGLVILLGIIAYGGWFYYTNLRGVGPVYLGGYTPVLDGLNREREIVTGTQKFDNTPFTTPSRFKVSVLMTKLATPRDLELDPRGTVIVSIPETGKVIALNEENGIEKIKVVNVAEDLNKPHGLAFDCNVDHCYLYVAEENQISRFNYNIDEYSASNKEKIVDLPTGGRHWTRSIIKYEDGLLVSIGSSCDTCQEEDGRRGSVQYLNLAERTLTPFATGLRNSVFLTKHPTTEEIWATEMGRDFLGDDLPPDEINILNRGGNYGWPICYGKNIHDTVFDKNTYIRNPCQEPTEIPSRIDVPAHSAPLGLSFFPGSWGEAFKDDLLVVYHGSWNRTEPTGYKIVRFNLNENGDLESTEDFITGWLSQDKKTSFGRPVDVLVREDKKIFVSDDKAGVVYLVEYFE
ncbi:MAG TPA: PQQ-dependent sugar dehydrogenase [Patescibacteria group bacterium]|nr:PQQ-dependent sugar dehydrogenase [Patescibacteria group bacterium]